MSTRRDFPSIELKEENDKLVQIYLAQEDCSIEEIIDRYASPEFKAYLER